MRPVTKEEAENLRENTGVRFRGNKSTAILIIKDSIRLKPAKIALRAVFCLF